MRRRLLLLFVGAAAVALVFAVVGWMAVRASLPPIDGQLSVNGLSDRVHIVRDDAGIPTITASNRGDLAFGAGFVHGQDRFFQMDLIRRQAAGELAALFGEAAIEFDKKNRFHRFRAVARHVLAAASREQRDILHRYTAGVNAGLASLGARPFEYLLLRQTPESWRDEDSIVVVYAMFMQLNDTLARKDLRRGYVHRFVPKSVYAWLYPAGTSWDAPIMGEPRSPERYPPNDVYSVRDWDSQVIPTDEEGPRPLDGSNNWAVSGRLTESGRALVANDMHLGLSVPNIYYQARFVQTGAGSRDVTGVTLPGTPFVVAGSNGHVAWGYTNSYGDWSDAVVLKPGMRDGTYRTPDGEQSYVVYRETIDVVGVAPVQYDIRETIWGPVDETVHYPDGEIAVSWIAHKPEAVNLNILQLETAKSVPEALDIANTMGMPPQNFVVGDASGSIGWTIAGKIPRRRNFDATVPVDWGKQHGWTGWYAPSEYPRVIDPESGRIWSANARVADFDALDVIGDGGYDLGARAQQIRDALIARDRFSPTDMLAIQIDDRALFLERWQQLLLRVLDEGVLTDKPELREYRRLVADWGARAVPESVGYRLVRGFRLDMRKRVFRALMAPVREQYSGSFDALISNQFEAPLWQLVTEQPEHLLPGNFTSWDQFMLDVIEDYITSLKRRYGGQLSERAWGEYNTANIQHPLSAALPVLSTWLDMPRDVLHGDVNLPRAQGPDFGASERFAVSPGDEANGVMHMPTGQSGHPLSEFYRRGHADWLQGRPSPFLPGEPAFTLTLAPASGKMNAGIQ